MLDAHLSEDDPLTDPDKIEFTFIFSLIWSFGASLKTESRRKFEDMLRKVSARVFPPSSLFDNFYDIEGRNFINWEKLVGEYQPPSDGKFSKIIVPTQDTKRFSYLLNKHVNDVGIKRPVLFVGESGTAKSVITSAFINQLNQDNWMKLSVNFSSRTTSADLQATIEDNIDKRSGRIFGPK